MHQFLIILSLLLLAAPCLAAEPDKPEQLRGEMSRLMSDLDSDSYDVRDRAAKRLKELVARSELGKFLAEEFHRTLIRTDVSFEVRKRLEQWRRELPKLPPQPVGKVSPKDLDELVLQLDDDSYGVRLGAAERLDWMLGDPKLIFPLMERLKRRLTDERLTTESRRPIKAAWQRARGAWLVGKAIVVSPLPKVSDEQIALWLDGLEQSDRRSESAERELLDLLARDEYVPKLKRMFEERMARGQNADAAARLQSLLDWTKPAMVAEFWQNRKWLGEQHLSIGVPSQSAGAVRPSHFDRIDDHTAHCVSGNSLSPGDYPVGVAFPHPTTEDAFFHLINLSTPRLRMAYPYTTEVQESKRLKAISRRTLDQFATEGRMLSESELVMLAGLDPVEVSQFASKHFLAIEDGSTAATGPPRWGGRPSRFGMICAQLALDGTKDAAPGLIEAISNGRFMPPTARAPYKLHLIAALSIASRDPWPKADRWLANCLTSDEPLIAKETDLYSETPTLDATAAAVLLHRHDQTPSRFSLIPIEDPTLNQIQLNTYRFENEESRKKVQQWWAEKKSQEKTP